MTFAAVAPALARLQREFPLWEITAENGKWRAELGTARHTAGSVAELRDLLAAEPEIPGWRVWRTRRGRCWATRIEPWPDTTPAQERTVYALSLSTLATAVRKQERAAR